MVNLADYSIFLTGITVFSTGRHHNILRPCPPPNASLLLSLFITPAVTGSYINIHQSQYDIGSQSTGNLEPGLKYQSLCTKSTLVGESDAHLELS
jgi:hypothetical protein